MTVPFRAVEIVVFNTPSRVGFHRYEVAISHEERREWLRTTLKSCNWYWREIGSGIEYHFRDEKEALLFKLKFPTCL